MTSNFDTGKVKTANGCAVILAATAVAFIAIIGILAFVAMLGMWAWGLFMVPVFGLPLLSFQEAFGALTLLLIIRFMFIQSPRGTKK